MTNNNQKFGAVDWDSVKFGKGQFADNENKTEFMRLKNGDNTIRLLTKPYQYLVWLGWKPTEEVPEHVKNKFGERVMSSIFHGEDPLMQEPWNLKFPQRRWLAGCIDRATGSYKILDMGPSIFEKLQFLNKKRGDPLTYDVTITKNPENPPASFYSLLNEEKTPLSASDLEIKEQVDIEDLKRRVSPPTYNEVKERIQKIIEKYSVQSSAPGTAKAEEETDDTDFPSANV